MTRLLRRPRPFADESCPGYIARVAEANGYPKASWIYKIAGTSASFVQIDHPVKGLADCLDVEPTTLVRMSYRPNSGRSAYSTRSLNGHPVPLPMLNLKTPKYCPICLGEKPYRRRCWDVRFITICPKHRVLLKETCPECEEPLNWQYSNIASCWRCGASLAGKKATPSVQGEKMNSYLHARIENKTTNSLEQFAILSALSVFGLCQLLLFIGLHAIRRGIGKGFHAACSTSLNENQRMMSKCEDIFSHWPIGFDLFLQQYIPNNSNSRLHTGLDRSFGTFYETLFKSFKDPQFSFLRNAFAETVGNNWSGGFLTSKNTRTDSCSSQNWLTKQEASKRLRCRPQTILRLIENKDLMAKRLPMGSRWLTLVSAKSLINFDAERKDWMTFEQTRSYLNISERTLRSLIKTKLVVPLNRAPPNRSRSTLFSRQETRNFLGDLEDRSNERVAGISLSKAARIASSKSISISSLLVGTYQNQIKLGKVDQAQKGLHRLSICERSIQQLF